MYNHNNVVRKQASKQANDFKLVHQMWNVCSVMVCIHRSICRGRRPWVGWGRGRTGWGRDGGTARRRACRPHSPSPLGRDDEERERVSEWVSEWDDEGSVEEWERERDDDDDDDDEGSVEEWERENEWEAEVAVSWDGVIALLGDRGRLRRGGSHL